MKVDFTKPAPELNPPTRTFASVYLPDNTNIAEFIVRQVCPRPQVSLHV